MALGFVAGFIGRAIILASRWLGHTLPSILVLFATFICVPAVAYGLTTLQSKIEEARRAPPSNACLSSLHAAKLGPLRLELPLAPAIAVGEGDEYEPAYPFDINERARAFCSKAAASPPSLTNLTVTIEPGFGDYLTVRTSFFCARTQPYGWWHDVCRRERADPPSKYPVRVTAYVIARYNAARMHAFSADALSKFQARGPSTKVAQGVESYDEGHYNYYTRADLPGYLARCYRSNSGHLGDIYCVAGYRLTPALGLIYDFRTHEADFAGRSKKVDQKAKEILLSLQPRMQ